jgi:putative transposase
MPVPRKKKRTTTNVATATAEQPTPTLPDPQEFQQHLRGLALGTIRILLEAVMCEELDALIGVGWGESSPQRKGYRDGYYQRDLITTTGRITDLKVPRDREGQFHTQVFDRYRRDAPQVAEGLTQMFVSGTSTRHLSGE